MKSRAGVMQNLPTPANLSACCKKISRSGCPLSQTPERYLDVARHTRFDFAGGRVHSSRYRTVSATKRTWYLDQWRAASRLRPLPSPFAWRHSRPSCKCARKAARIGVTERKGNVRDFHFRAYEQLAGNEKAGFINKLPKTYSLSLQATVQCSRVHGEFVGNSFKCRIGKDDQGVENPNN
jgi:hypothetical protein